MASDALERVAKIFEGKCGCAMSAAELLVANAAHQKPKRSILIVDRGNGWDVTQYGPDSAGRPRDGSGPDCITLQAAMELVEETMVKVRREPDPEAAGEIITDPAEIARTLSGK